jgi:hypothetical protein
MFWWFEREGVYTRYEVLDLPNGGYELRIVDAAGAEYIEQFDDTRQLADRQRTLETRLKATGWSGPHGRVL